MSVLTPEQTTEYYEGLTRSNVREAVGKAVERGFLTPTPTFPLNRRTVQDGHITRTGNYNTYEPESDSNLLNNVFTKNGRLIVTTSRLGEIGATSLIAEDRLVAIAYEIDDQFGLKFGLLQRAKEPLKFEKGHRYPFIMRFDLGKTPRSASLYLPNKEWNISALTGKAVSDALYEAALADRERYSEYVEFRWSRFTDIAVMVPSLSPEARMALRFANPIPVEM